MELLEDFREFDGFGGLMNRIQKLQKEHANAMNRFLVN